MSNYNVKITTNVLIDLFFSPHYELEARMYMSPFICEEKKWEKESFEFRLNVDFLLKRYIEKV